MKPSYDLAKTVARAVAKVAGANGSPIILVFDQDMARVTGEILLNECGPGRDIICVDEVELRDFDYIDIGEPFIKPGTFSDHLVVPVVVKSLVFSC
jgi:ethanolamine utilization protein EutA